MPAYAVLEWQHSIHADWMRLARHDLDHIHCDVKRVHDPCEYPEPLRRSIVRRRKTHEVWLVMNPAHYLVRFTFCFLFPTMPMTRGNNPSN